MDIKEFAKSISGRERQHSQLFTKEEIRKAKENGFVIVCGASDDLMELRGAIDDEVDCYGGGRVCITKMGVFSAYRQTYGNSWIDANWCDEDARDESNNIITWTYETDIPHETFMIYEDGEPFCRGIVFDIKDVK